MVGCSIHFQNTLLQQLGIAPFSEGPWPLYIHPQSLSVLSRLLLIWQHKASVQGEPDVPECMKVWERYGNDMSIIVCFTINVNFQDSHFINESMKEINIKHA